MKKIIAFVAVRKKIVATCLFQALDEILSFASDFDFVSKSKKGCSA